MKFYGAVWGVGEGPTGDAYAIPTKDEKIKTLPLSEIDLSVHLFLAYAREHPELRFEVVKIGCGLAGYHESQIAPMFHDASENVILPDGWRRIADYEAGRTGSDI